VPVRVQTRDLWPDTISRCMHQLIQPKSLSWWEEVGNSLILQHAAAASVCAPYLCLLQQEWFCPVPPCLDYLQLDAWLSPKAPNLIANVCFLLPNLLTNTSSVGCCSRIYRTAVGFLASLASFLQISCVDCWEMWIGDSLIKHWISMQTLYLQKPDASIKRLIEILVFAGSLLLVQSICVNFLLC